MVPPPLLMTEMKYATIRVASGLLFEVKDIAHSGHNAKNHPYFCHKEPWKYLVSLMGGRAVCVDSFSSGH